jgi:hypothetical protein
MSEGKTFSYFLAIMAFDWVQFTAVRLMRPSGPIPPWQYFDTWFALAVTLGAMVYLFLCNGGPRGKHFLYRYFPLSVVVGWKVVAAASLVALPAVKFALSGASPSVSAWSQSATLAAMNLFMFFRIGHHLRWLAGETRGITQPLQRARRGER